MNKQTKETHAERSKRQPRPCAAQDMTFGGLCLNCGFGPIEIEDAPPAHLAYLALNGSYGEKLVATMLLESVARPEPSWSEINPFPKGRWT